MTRTEKWGALRLFGPLTLLLAGLVAATCSGVVRAQTVRLENLSDAPYAGWKRVTVDRLPPHPIGRVGDTLFVVGRRVGLETHVVDLKVTLPAGGKLTVDLASSSTSNWTRPALPIDPISHFGGPVTLGSSTAMQWVSLQPDGAGYSAHLRARTGRMLCTDLWLTWYPDQPGWCSGEALITASNPAVPDLSATVPDGFRLQFGSSLIILPGAGVNVPLVAAGTVFADGQARAVPVVFVWPHRVADWPSAVAACRLAVCGVGIGKLLADGSPSYPTGFNPRAWASGLLPGSVARLHSFAPALIGPASASGTAGEQWDSAFTCGEALLPGGVGCELVTYLAALKLAARPCHHLEADGSQLDPSTHTQRLVMWDGRAHWHSGVSPDRLGKLANLTPEQASGWFGPDVEHAMFATLAAGARYTGSPALQQMLRQLAVLYPLQWTTTPGWSNSQPFAARAVGWEGMLAVHLWRELEDRAMAQKVRDHYAQRVAMVLVPQLGSKPGDWWDVRVDDPRLGSGARVIPWQQALGSYGIDLAGAQVGLPEARAVALRAAKRVLADAWRLDGARWVCCASGLSPTASDATFDESFCHYGMPLAACVVLRHEPGNERAKAILAQVRASATEPKHTRWLAPGVQ